MISWKLIELLVEKYFRYSELMEKFSQEGLLPSEELEARILEEILKVWEEKMGGSILLFPPIKYIPYH